MKVNILIQGVCILMLGWSISGCSEKYDKEVEKTIYVNKSSVGIYVGDRLQLTASPVGVTYDWTSEDTGVVTVTADGVVEGVGAGWTNIVISCADARKTVPVTVAVRIPLTGITVDTESLENVSVGTQVQVNAVPVPANATEVSLVWSSENAAVATVSASGKIEAVGVGTTKIIVGQGNIRKEISVSVIVALDRSNWEVIAVSDETASDGGGKNTIIDGNPGTYWHSQWGPDIPCPHWVIIDMKTPKLINRIATTRRNNSSNVGDTKSLQYFVSDNPDPASPAWEKIGEGSYASTGAPHVLTLDIDPPVKARYLKLNLTESFRGPYTAIVNIDVYSAE